jgi:hypothetical protein
MEYLTFRERWKFTKRKFEKNDFVLRVGSDEVDGMLREMKWNDTNHIAYVPHAYWSSRPSADGYNHVSVLQVAQRKVYRHILGLQSHWHAKLGSIGIHLKWHFLSSESHAESNCHSRQTPWVLLLKSFC